MHPIRGQVVTATVTATYSEMASVLCLPVLPQAANAEPERCPKSFAFDFALAGF